MRRAVPWTALVAAALLVGTAGSALPAPAPLADALGVEVLGVLPSAAGYMLDFRFKLVDLGKAAPLLDRRVQPILIDESGQSRLEVPTDEMVGSLRQLPKHPRVGQTLAVIFANPGRGVQDGDTVAIQFGDHLIEGLVVGQFAAPAARPRSDGAVQ